MSTMSTTWCYLKLKYIEPWQELFFISCDVQVAFIIFYFTAIILYFLYFLFRFVLFHLFIFYFLFFFFIFFFFFFF